MALNAVLAVVLAGALPAGAEEGVTPAPTVSGQTVEAKPPADCAPVREDEPVSGPGKPRRCAAARIELAEEALGGLLNELIGRLEPADADADADADSADPLAEADARRLESLRESQQSWERYRQAACDEVYYGFWPGSLAEDARLACLLELTRERIAYLRERLAD